MNVNYLIYRWWPFIPWQWTKVFNTW